MNEEPKYKNKEWLRERYVKEGMLKKEIAELSGVSSTTITWWLNRFNFKRRYKDKNWLRKKYIGEGREPTEIAKLANVHKSTIHTWLKKFGIKRTHKYRNREWLHHQYIDNELSVNQIGKKLGVGKSVIQYWLHKFDIPFRDRGETFSILYGNDVKITEKVKELFDGTLLGDGSLSTRNRYSARYKLGQASLSYINWRKHQLKGFNFEQSGEIRKEVTDAKTKYERLAGSYENNKGKTYTLYHFKTLDYHQLKNEYERWYPNGFKKVPKDIELTPFNLLVWFLEDGSFSPSACAEGQITLYTNNFDESSVNFLIDQLSELFQNNNFNKARSGKHRPLVQFGSRKLVKSFFSYLAPLPEELYKDYSYKIPDQFLTLDR